MSFPGRPHNLMSLDELSELVKDSVEPLKQKAEQRLDELSVLMKETTQTLNHRDTETDATVTLIHNTRDEHVSAIQFITNNFRYAGFAGMSHTCYWYASLQKSL